MHFNLVALLGLAVTLDGVSLFDCDVFGGDEGWEESGEGEKGEQLEPHL